MESNVLGRHFSGAGLIRFALPNILMLIFTSIYVIVDGFFTARFVNTMAVGSLNIVYPVISLYFALSFMLATGGSAIVARQMGQGRPVEARENFTFITVVSLGLGIVVSVLGVLYLEPLMRWLGASDLQFEQCCSYGLIIMIFAPMCMLQCLFQVFFVTAGHPGVGLAVTLVAGVSNMIFDYVFMGPMAMGIAGAAWATVIGYCVVAVFGGIFFFVRRREVLHVVRPKVRGKVLGGACLNGSSEMVTNLAICLTTFLFNYYFMRFYAEDGVSSISIVQYIQFIFNAIIFGYGSGVAPVISYKYGHRDLTELGQIIRNGLIFIVLASAGAYIVSLITLDEMLLLFVDRSDRVFEISRDGFVYFAPCLLFMGIGIFASSMFTALSDGKTSAIISFSRTLVFLSLCIVFMSEWFGAKGAWSAMSAAEFMGMIVATVYLVRNSRELRQGRGLFSEEKLGKG